MSGKHFPKDKALDLCESPIERLFLDVWIDRQRMLVREQVVQSYLWVMKGHPWPGIIWQFAPFIDLPDKPSIYIIPQDPFINPFRFDFRVLYTAKNPKVRKSVVVECDGHDFHERTKEQAAHDRARDRCLQAKGHVVFRFTGSELNRDAEGCVKEVEKLLKIGEIACQQMRC